MADEADVLRSHYPLKGMVLCCTSVEMGARTEIQKKCEEMGGRHLLDLTSEVTHLICGDLFSPKYRYVARMRPDVKVLSPHWVDAMYAQWIEGEDIDPRVFETECRFPVFYALRISVTGIADVAERKRIEEICHQEAASYHPDLTKDVTHLIAAAPTGKKYEFARLHKIAVVTPEWLTDSIERGMALDEQFYDPMLEPAQIGVGAKPAKSTVQTEVAEYRGKRKIRKATQDKLGGQSQTLWDDIVGQAANVKPAKRDEWEESLHVVNGIDDHREPGFKPKPADQPLVRAKTGGMFANASFWVWGFVDKRKAQLKEILLPLDGIVVDSLDDLVASESIWRLVMVPREKRTKECPPIPTGQDIVMVTEWWLESCMFYQKFITPMGDFTTIPLDEFQIEEMKGLDICITKFIGIDLLFYPRLVRLVGANFHDVLTKRRTLLITNDSRESESQKIRYAHENNVPVVTGEWLVECLKQNTKLPYEEYLIKPSKIPEARPLLGDRFKRKPDTELSNASKRPLLEVDAVGQQSSGGESGKGKQPQRSSPRRNDRSEERKEGHTLGGCTVCISDQLKMRDDKLANIAEELGAMVLDAFDENTRLTHLMHWSSPSKPLNMSRDYRVASSIAGCSIVSREWLYVCKEAGKRINEKIFFLSNAHATSDDHSESTTTVEQEGLEPPKAKESTAQQDLRSSFRPIPPLPQPPQPKISSSTQQVPVPQPEPASAPPMAHPRISPLGQRDSASRPTSAPAGPLAERSNVRVNEATSSPTRGSMEPPERKTSNLSGISEILGKLGKDQLMASNTHRKARGRLQGKATAGKQRMFSRTPSGASVTGEATGLQPNPTHVPSASQEPSNSASMADEPVLSQALGYNSEETSMEKKIVRAKLDRTAPLDSPRGLRDRVQKPRGAVDLVPVARRSGRKKESGGAGGF